jgi:DHA2 family multidrug resistance protein
VFLPVGFLQALVAPLAGIFSDRFTPKIPAALGMLIMAYSFYQLSNLSLFSERNDIMFPLYLRGISIGILFAPLTTLAISEISHQKMAQASGLFNVIRQIGGSFGVAAFGTLLTRRTIYHATTYGEQVNAYSDSFKQTMIRLQHFAQHAVGGTATESVARAKAQIGTFVANQAFIRAVDDVFLVAAVVLLVGVIPVFFLKTRKFKSAGGHAGPKPAQAPVE